MSELEKLKKEIRDSGKDIVSVSFVQIKLKCGYNHAYDLLIELAQAGFLYKNNAIDWVVIK